MRDFHEGSNRAKGAEKQYLRQITSVNARDVIWKTQKALSSLPEKWIVPNGCQSWVFQFLHGVRRKSEVKMLANYRRSLLLQGFPAYYKWIAWRKSLKMGNGIAISSTRTASASLCIIMILCFANDSKKRQTDYNKAEPGYWRLIYFTYSLVQVGQH